MRGSVRILGAALAVVPATLVQVTPITDLDLWWLLKTGEHMVTTRTFPRLDPFSWTAQGAPWLNHTWGFELLLYGVYAAAGFAGLVALQALFALATFGVMYWTLRREAVPVPGAVALIWIAALAMRGFWSPRPQIVTYLGIAILWAIVWEYRAGRGDRLWWLPALTAVWVNLHGGFFIALVVLGLATLGEAADRLFDAGEVRPNAPRVGRMAAVWVACVAAALLNPFHVHALTFPLDVAADRAAKDLIIEWFSPAFQYPQLRLFEGLLLFFLAALPAVRRRVRLTEIVILVAFVHLTLDATRNIPLFVIVLAPLAGRAGVEAWARLRSVAQALGQSARPRVLAAACLAVLVPLGGLRDLARLRIETLRPEWAVADIFPSRAADFLLANPLPGPLFNDYGWGGYLTWRLYPRYRVFIDGRVAIYSPDVREDFLTINNGRPGWREALERRGVRLVLIRNRTALAALLREARGWSVAYEDGLAVVFQRRPGAA